MTGVIVHYDLNFLPSCASRLPGRAVPCLSFKGRSATLSRCLPPLRPDPPNGVDEFRLMMIRRRGFDCVPLSTPRNASLLPTCPLIPLPSLRPPLRQRLAEFLKDTYGAVSNEVLERSDKASKQALEEVRC